MAPRANWKGYLRLSLVSCPILLYPATSDAEKVRFRAFAISEAPSPCAFIARTWVASIEAGRPLSKASHRIGP
jgi:hypothetical protein